MQRSQTLISIGMPVFNGENYIEETIESILAQTYTNFELIISDNASDDRTEEICRAYGAKDERIHYYRSKENLGAAKNYNKVFKLSSGKYFKWAAHDDLIMPDFLQTCIEVLEQDSSVVLCYSKVKIIDENGKVLSNYKVKIKDAGSFNPQNRYKGIILSNHWGIEIFGLIRANALNMTPLIASYAGSDRPLIAELSLLGRFHQIPEFLFLSRDHPQRSVRQATIHFLAGWFDPSKAGDIVFPQWRIFIEYLRAVRRIRLSPYQKLLCYLNLSIWIGSNFNWLRMLMDFIMVLEPKSWNILLSIKQKFSRIR